MITASDVQQQFEWLQDVGVRAPCYIEDESMCARVAAEYAEALTMFGLRADELEECFHVYLCRPLPVGGWLRPWPGVGDILDMARVVRNPRPPLDVSAEEYAFIANGRAMGWAALGYDCAGATGAAAELVARAIFRVKARLGPDASTQRVHAAVEKEYGELRDDFIRKSGGAK